MVAMAAGPGGWLGPAFGLRLLLAAVLQAVCALGAEFSSEACRELGFSSNLLCSSCDLLGQFNLLQLDPDCRGCCQEEAQFETKKHFMRVLSLKFVDENWGGSLKSKAFVRSDKPKLFRGLQIKYVRGSDPVLKLLDDNGNIAEELSILKWNTDSVEEFLSEKLERI
ncbi:selenoprotein F isoform X1 [Prionailurus iriomotensis]